MTSVVKRRTLSRERVAAAALELIEREGLGRLTMRRLGGELGVEGMALYTHVRNKDDLLNAVADLVLESLDVDFGPDRSWQERLRHAARSWAELQERFPRAFPLIFRSGLQTNRVRVLTEEMLDALRTAGFDERGTAEAYQAFVVLLDSALIGRSSWTDAELQAAWRRGAASVDASVYPRFAEIAPRAAELTWPVMLDVSLDILIDGLEARLDRC
jgi:AcrR family transcriptional regulator